MNSSASFFVKSVSAKFKQCESNIFTSNDIKAVFDLIKPGSVLYIDIDDTIANVPIPKEVKNKITQEITEKELGDPNLSFYLRRFNLCQLQATEMLPVDPTVNIGELIRQLKERDITVIGLTARSAVLCDKTIELLHSIGVEMSTEAIADNTIKIAGKDVVVKEAIVFAGGVNKGECIDSIDKQELLPKKLKNYTSVNFIDDNDNNCKKVDATLRQKKIDNYKVWRYKAPVVKSVLTFHGRSEKPKRASTDGPSVSPRYNLRSRSKTPAP